MRIMGHKCNLLKHNLGKNMYMCGLMHLEEETECT
jgi:hypothetical protein